MKKQQQQKCGSVNNKIFCDMDHKLKSTKRQQRAVRESEMLLKRERV